MKVSGLQFIYSFCIRGRGGVILKERVAEQFRRFAVNECHGSSDLYEVLAQQIAEDEELLQLASYSQPGQPTPNLFFAAVHFLLLNGTEDELSFYYESIVEKPKPVEQAYQPFRHFCLQHREEIINILQTRLVQTNEVRR